MKPRDLRCTSRAPRAAFLVASAVACVSAQAPTSVIDDASPLYRAAVLLGGRYAVAVTYEDPILQRPEDMLLTGNNPDSPISYEPRMKHLRVPDDLTPNRTPKLDGGALGKLLEAYHASNPDGIRFKILETTYGLHVVPDTVLDLTGKPVRATTPLDATITVPEGERMATEHLKAISDAVERASGVHLLLIDEWVDQYYAANGLSPAKNVLVPILLGWSGPEAKLPYSFVWGAAGVSGRQALLSLLDTSATTLVWHVNCHPHPVPGKSMCMFNVVPLRVPITGPDGVVHQQELAFDRCVKCPRLPAPRPQTQRQ